MFFEYPRRELTVIKCPSAVDKTVSENPVAAIERLLDEAATYYSPREFELSRAISVPQYIDLIEAYPRVLSYDFVSQEVATYAFLVQQKNGLEGLCHFHACVLIALIRRNYRFLLESCYPEDIKVLGIENFSRILSILIAGEPDFESTVSHRAPRYLHYHSDRFFKDLSAASLRLLVCGGRKLCRVDFPRGLLKTHPLQMMRYIASHGMSGVYLETHFDSNDHNLKARFGEKSWRQVLCNAGRIMQLDPSIKGFTGHSWYYDPCLKTIAPGLAHIAALVVENGGYRFCTGASDDTTESALRGSSVRQGLYKLGFYQPRRFKILWPRKAALRWLEAQ